MARHFGSSRTTLRRMRQAHGEASKIIPIPTRPKARQASAHKSHIIAFTGFRTKQ